MNGLSSVHFRTHFPHVGVSDEQDGPIRKVKEVSFLLETQDSEFNWMVLDEGKTFTSSRPLYHCVTSADSRDAKKGGWVATYLFSKEAFHEMVRAIPNHTHRLLDSYYRHILSHLHLDKHQMPESLFKRLSTPRYERNGTLAVFDINGTNVEFLFELDELGKVTVRRREKLTPPENKR